MPFVQLGRLKAYYERAGNGSRLLFVSGSGGDLRAKPGVFESPLARAFDLLAYDQRGLGQTDKPAGPYSMQDYADDAAKLLDALDWERCIGDGRVVRRNGRAGNCAAASTPRVEVGACVHQFRWSGWCQLSVARNCGHADRGSDSVADVDQRYEAERRLAARSSRGGRTSAGVRESGSAVGRGRAVAASGCGVAARRAKPARYVGSIARTSHAGASVRRQVRRDRADGEHAGNGGSYSGIRVAHLRRRPSIPDSGPLRLRRSSRVAAELNERNF